jgi:hypothetical protein
MQFAGYLPGVECFLPSRYVDLQRQHPIINTNLEVFKPKHQIFVVKFASHVHPFSYFEEMIMLLRNQALNTNEYGILMSKSMCSNSE